MLKQGAVKQTGVPFSRRARLPGAVFWVTDTEAQGWGLRGGLPVRVLPPPSPSFSAKGENGGGEAPGGPVAMLLGDTGTPSAPGGGTQGGGAAARVGLRKAGLAAGE